MSFLTTLIFELNTLLVLRIWKVTKLVLLLVDLTDWHVSQLKVDMWPPNLFYFKRKIQKNIFFFKKKNPLGHKGMARPPPWSQGGGQNHPQWWFRGCFDHSLGPMGVISATPNTHWGWFRPPLWAHGGGSLVPNEVAPVFFFLNKKYI